MRRTADVFYARSQLAVQSRKLQQAFELARQAVEQDPERIEFLTWTARLALNLNLADTALEYVHRAWQLDPDDRDLTLAYADLLARTGNQNEARRVMSEMVQTPDVMFSRIMFEIVIAEQSSGSRPVRRIRARCLSTMPRKRPSSRPRLRRLWGIDEQSIVLYGQVTTGERALASAIRRAELMAQSGDLEGARAALARAASRGR